MTPSSAPACTCINPHRHTHTYTYNQEGNSAACQHRKRWRGQQSRAVHTPRSGLPRPSCLQRAKALRYPPPPGIRLAPRAQRDSPPTTGRGGQRARVDRRSRPGRAVRLAHTDAALPGPAVQPGSGSQPRTKTRRGPRGRGGASAGAREPAACSEPQPGRRRRRAAVRIVQPAARAPEEPGPVASSPAGAEGTVVPPPALPPPPLPAPQRRRPCRWRAASSPLVPSLKSSVLCLAAAIVWRGPVPCLGRRPRETEGPRGVSGCGLAGSALRRGRPGVGGGRGRGQATRGAGAGPTRLLEEETGTPPAPNLKRWV